MVQAQAEELTQAQAALIVRQAAALPRVAAVAVDIYDAPAQEMTWQADGVCVSEQKAVRDQQPKAGKERTTTDLALLAKPDGRYRTIIAGRGIDAVQLYRAEIVQAWGAQAAQLPVVALSEGARSLQQELQAVFGAPVTHILEWYHLQAKVCLMMTMIAPHKAAQQASNEVLLHALWHGGERQGAHAFTGTDAEKCGERRRVGGVFGEEPHDDY
jgi:hypothetical protein